MPLMMRYHERWEAAEYPDRLRDSEWKQLEAETELVCPHAIAELGFEGLCNACLAVGRLSHSKGGMRCRSGVDAYAARRSRGSA